MRRFFSRLLEERWFRTGKDEYCRESFRVDVRGSFIASLSVYCTDNGASARETGHAKVVQLPRP